MEMNTVSIKLEYDEEDATLQCELCEKMFYHEVALRNHWKIEHVAQLESGQSPSANIKPAAVAVTATAATKPGKSNANTEKTKSFRNPDTRKKIDEDKTAKFLSSLKPVNLASLASEDVSYIIIKAEDGGQHQEKKTKVAPVEKVKRSYTKRTDPKDLVPLKGPFECLQPSSVVGDTICHQIFFSCCDYSTHFRDEHTKRRKGQRCQVCEKPLYPTEGAEDQINTGLYGCQVCSEQFNTNKELNQHIDTSHSELRPFQCLQCLKRFSQQGGLIQHMRMHTGERPFVCIYCSKSFTQKSGLDQHLRIHTKAKPYRCVVCGKTFCQSIHMKQHMRVHTNVSPFQCALCKKRFKQSSHLNYHLKSHDKSDLTEAQRERLSELLAMSEEKSDLTQSHCEEEMIVSDMVVVEQGEYDETEWNVVHIPETEE